jgi:hypothetical protein
VLHRSSSSSAVALPLRGTSPSSGTAGGSGAVS